jgi:hypothetical protein
MKDLKDMTAAELVAELERRRADRPTVTLQNIDPWFINAGEGVAEAKIAENERNWIESMSAITAELDARCKQWGLKLEQLPHGPVWIINKDMLCNHGDFYECYLFASEFHALLGYLLSKEVKP